MSDTDENDEDLYLQKQSSSNSTESNASYQTATSLNEKFPSFLDHTNDNVKILNQSLYLSINSNANDQIARKRATSSSPFFNYQQYDPTANNKNGVIGKVGQSKYRSKSHEIRNLNLENKYKKLTMQKQNINRSRSNANGNLALKEKNPSVFITKNRDKKKKSGINYSAIVEKLLKNNTKKYDQHKGIAGDIKNLLNEKNPSVFIEENRDEEKKSKTSYSVIVKRLLENNTEEYIQHKGIAGHIEDLYLSKNIVIKRIDNNEFREWTKLINETDVLKKTPASVPSFLGPFDSLESLVHRLKPYGNISKNVAGYFKKSTKSMFIVMENIARDNLTEQQKQLTNEEIYKNIQFIDEKTSQKKDSLVLGTKKLKKTSHTEYKDWLKLKNFKFPDKTPSFEGPWEGYYSMFEAIEKLYPNEDKKKTKILIKEVEEVKKHFIESKPKITSGKIYDVRSCALDKKNETIPYFILINKTNNEDKKEPEPSGREDSVFYPDLNVSKIFDIKLGHVTCLAEELLKNKHQSSKSAAYDRQTRHQKLIDSRFSNYIGYRNEGEQKEDCILNGISGYINYAFDTNINKNVVSLLAKPTKNIPEEITKIALDDPFMKSMINLLPSDFNIMINKLNYIIDELDKRGTGYIGMSLFFKFKNYGCDVRRIDFAHPVDDRKDDEKNVSNERLFSKNLQKNVLNSQIMGITNIIKISKHNYTRNN